MSEVIEAEVVEENTTAVAVRQAPGELRTDGIFAGIDIRTPSGLEQAMTAAGNMLQLVENVRKMTIQLTTEGEWDELGGGVDLSEAGCERMMTILGAHVEITSEKWEWDDQAWIPEAKQFIPDKSGHYGIRMKVRISHPMFGIRDGIGLAHSTDGFLGTKGDAKQRAIDAGADPQHVKGRLIQDVSRHAIYQHAYTRAKGNAIRKLLGVKGLKRKQLQAYGLGGASGARIDFEAAQKERDLGEQKPRPTLRIKAAIDSKKVASEDCLAWLREHHGYEGDTVNRAGARLIDLLAEQLDTDHRPVKASGDQGRDDVVPPKTSKAKASKASKTSKSRIQQLRKAVTHEGLSLADLGPRARVIEDDPQLPGVAKATAVTIEQLIDEVSTEDGRRLIQDALVAEAEA